MMMGKRVRRRMEDNCVGRTWEGERDEAKQQQV